MDNFELLLRFLQASLGTQITTNSMWLVNITRLVFNHRSGKFLHCRISDTLSSCNLLVFVLDCVMLIFNFIYAIVVGNGRRVVVVLP